MSLKSMLFAGSALAVLFAFATPAGAAPYYRCGYDWCYDDQYEDTRELNLLQLEHPGAGVYAVPGYQGPGYDDDEDDYDDGYGARGWDRDGDDDDYGFDYGTRQWDDGDDGDDSGSPFDNGDDDDDD